MTEQSMVVVDTNSLQELCEQVERYAVDYSNDSWYKCRFCMGRYNPILTSYPHKPDCAVLIAKAFLDKIEELP